jgi:hypothetical protein
MAGCGLQYLVVGAPSTPPKDVPVRSRAGVRDTEEVTIRGLPSYGTVGSQGDLYM